MNIIPEEYRSAFNPLRTFINNLRKKKIQRFDSADWTEEIDTAFKDMKRLYTSPHVLAHPNLAPDAPEFILEADASRSGNGIILKQVQQDGSERAVGFYASTHKSNAAREAAAHDLEAACIVWGVRKLRHYLAGRKFRIRTDHSKLVWLLLKVHQGKKARWAAELMEHDFSVEYRKGIFHHGPDALSRSFFEVNALLLDDTGRVCQKNRIEMIEIIELIEIIGIIRYTSTETISQYRHE